MSSVKVSIALHKQEPKLDGNQRDWEVSYMNYNRCHVIMQIADDGHGEIFARELAFPNNAEDVTQVALFFSIGVAVAPGGQGGSIINYGPLENPIVISEGMAPLLTIISGIHAARLDEMRKDGRFFDSMEPDYERGLNLPD